MLDIQLEKPYWGKVFNIENACVFRSEEIQRVLAMEYIPAALIVKLPRTRSGCPDQATTDLLFYFPADGQVVVYEETSFDPLRKVGCDIRTLGTYQSSCHEYPVVMPKRFDYTVELAAFTNRPTGCKVCHVVYIIEFEATVGCAWLIIDVRHDDDHRDNESIQFAVSFGGNEGTMEKPTIIGTWTPSRNKETTVLSWCSCQGISLTKKETIPHIRDYHEEKEEW